MTPSFNPARVPEHLKNLDIIIQRKIPIEQSTSRLVIGLGIAILYIIFGALVYSQIESSNETQHLNDMRNLKNYLLRNKKCLSAEDLENLLEKISELTNKGISPLRNVTADPNWSFGQAFFYSGTLITTVGYGHVSPVTASGKAFTIMYCIIGIPLTLALLTAFVERLKIPATWLLAVMTRKCGKSVGVSNLRLVHLVILLVVLVILLFIIPASIFSILEPEWTFLDAFYYCFISLTTIGLGDYIPGDHPDQQYRALYKLFATAYLLIGLCFMMLLLSLLYEVPQFNCGKFFQLEDHPIDAQENNPLTKISAATRYGPQYEQQIDEPESPIEEGDLSARTPNRQQYNTIK